MERREATNWANLRSMLHALERALSNEVMTSKDIERLESLRYKIEREVMDAQVKTDLETGSLMPNNDPHVERENFFNSWEPSGYSPNT